MTSRRKDLKQISSFFLVVLGILIITVFFGQVLGTYYIDNINKEETPRQGKLPAQERISKKILRLNKFDYYCLQLAVCDEYDAAMQLGKIMAAKELPVVVSGHPPYRVLLGFVSKGESLRGLGESISIDGVKGEIIKGQVNSSVFKFQVNDNYAAEEIAPFLGRISLSMEKGLLLFTSIVTRDDRLAQLKPKFTMLAQELEELALDGSRISQGTDRPSYRSAMDSLSIRCREWARSLRQLDANWQDRQLLISQQQGLALLEEYHRFMDGTN